MLRDVELPFSDNDWENMQDIGNAAWSCGYCGAHVASKSGFFTAGSYQIFARACPNCRGLTMFVDEDLYFPRAVPGMPVTGIPAELADLYEEARNSAGAGAYTAAVMICRKMLMNVAVSEGAGEGLRFVDYVDYLESHHYFSPKARPFIDYIRNLGNEANHEIAPKSQDDAIAAIEFVGALLRHNYETPGKVPARQRP